MRDWIRSDIKKLDLGRVVRVEPVDGKAGAPSVPLLSLGRISYNRSLLESKLNYLMAQYSDPLDGLRVALDLATRCAQQGGGQESVLQRSEGDSPESATFQMKTANSKTPAIERGGDSQDVKDSTTSKKSETILLETKLRSSTVEQHNLVRSHMLGCCWQTELTMALHSCDIMV